MALRASRRLVDLSTPTSLNYLGHNDQCEALKSQQQTSFLPTIFLLLLLLVSSKSPPLPRALSSRENQQRRETLSLPENRERSRWRKKGIEREIALITGETKGNEAGAEKGEAVTVEKERDIEAEAQRRAGAGAEVGTGAEIKVKEEVRTSTDRLIEEEETVTADPQEKVLQAQADITDLKQTNAQDATETYQHTPYRSIHSLAHPPKSSPLRPIEKEVDSCVFPVFSP
jgi:hypothetical protein